MSKVRSFTCGPNGSITKVSAVRGGIAYELPIVNDQVSFLDTDTYYQWEVTADPGYIFYNITIDSIPHGNNSVGYRAAWLGGEDYLINLVTGIHINFGSKYGSITASSGSNGSVSPPGVTPISSGLAITYTITPNAGYGIQSVLVDGVSQALDGSFSFELNVRWPLIAPDQFVKTIHATFSSTAKTITVLPGANGSVSPGTSVVNLYSNKTFTFTPNPGYMVGSVIVDGVAVQSSVSGYTFYAVTSDHTLLVTFVRSTYNITSTVGPNGTASLSAAGNPINAYGQSTLERGTNAIYQFTPNNGYAVDNVIVDGVSLGSRAIYTFATIQADHTISVTFTSNVRTITVTAPTNGTIFPAGVQSVTIGSTKGFAIQPIAGYEVEDVLVDGVSVGAVSVYYFYNVQINHTISATFKILESYIIEVTSGANGSITPGGSAIAVKGTNKAFTITPNAHYHVANVLVDGVSVGAVTSYTFNNVQMAHTISATFAAETFVIQALAAAHGSITPSGEVTVNYGDTQSFVILPDEDYRIQDIIVDGVIVTMPSSGTLFID